MSDFYPNSYINQILNKYNTYNEIENNIFQNELNNLNLSIFKNIFDSNGNPFELDIDDSKDEANYFTWQKTNKSTSNSSTPIKTIFNIAKIIKKQNKNKNNNNKFTKKKERKATENSQ